MLLAGALSRRLSQLVALLLVSGMAVPAAGQATSGVFTGTMTDAQGGILPGVTLTLRNTDTGTTRTAVSEADGRYRIAGVPPGTYDLKAELSGFAPAEVKGLTLTIGAEVASNLTLQLEGMQESLTVTGQSPVVETTKTDVSGIVSQQQIDTLPIATREPVALALLMPGTSQDATRVRKFNANVGAGAMTNAGSFLIDGVWNKEPCTGEPRQDFPQAAIREFKVNVSQSTAEYGWTSSGAVTMETKSGTNLISGEAFEYYRSKALNAMNAFEQLNHDTNGAPKPDYLRNQFGASLGGPIITDRVHFFVAAERMKQDRYITVNTGHPEFYGSLEGIWPVPDYNNMVFSRGDVQISPNQTFFVRYAWQDADYTCDACGGTKAAFSNNGILQPRRAWAGGHTAVLSSHALNEVRFQWSFYGYYPHPPGVEATGVMYAFPASRTDPLTPIYNFPSLTWGTNGGASLFVEQFAREISDALSITTSWHGIHNWKVGGAFASLPTDDDVASSALGSWTFAVDQPFNPANPASVAGLRNATLFTASFPSIDRHLPNKYISAYIQDEWRPVSNVTLNIGLRYQYQKGFNQQLDINDKTMFPTTGTITQIPFVDFASRGDTNNLGPRLGLAWDVSSTGKSVARAAWGIYYNPVFTSDWRNEQTNYRQTAISISNPSYPDPYGGRSPSAFASTAPQNIGIMDNNIQNPKSMATTAGFSQSLSPTIAVHVDGVYTHTVEVPLLIDINPRSGGTTGVRPLPQFGRIQQLQSRGEVKYSALLVRLEKRYENRYQYLVSYTFAKAESNLNTLALTGTVVDSGNPGADWGPAANDRRHSLVASGSFLLPVGVTLGAVWSLRSTMPFSAVAGRDLNGDGNITDYVPGTTRAIGNRDTTTMLAAVNAYRASLAAGACGTPGQLCGPISASQIDSNRYNDVDVRVSKAFVVGHNRKIELIAQVFNLFGTDNLLASTDAGAWVTNATSSSFGRILQANPRQQAEFAARIVW
jgi:carboxypeptidase family protein